MSKFDSIAIDDLGLEFVDIDQLTAKMEAQISGKSPEVFEEDMRKPSNLTFGPSQTQLQSYSQWKDCDGKFFFPYNQMAKIGKICDFASEDKKDNIRPSKQSKKPYAEQDKPKFVVPAESNADPEPFGDEFQMIQEKPSRAPNQRGQQNTYQNRN